MKVTKVLIVMAMAAEANPIVSALELASIDTPAHMPFRWFRGPAASLDVMVAVNGKDFRHDVDSIATLPSALNALQAIQVFDPDLVITAGTAGGWSRHGTAVGDVFLNAERFVHHDRRIELGGFVEYGVGSYAGLAVDGLAGRLGFKVGTITTSNSLDESPTDDVQIRSLDGRVKEMEAAAVAYVCELFGTPVMAVKTITDLVDSPVATSEQFLDNFELASSRLREAIVAVLLELEDSSLDRLE